MAYCAMMFTFVMVFFLSINSQYLFPIRWTLNSLEGKCLKNFNKGNAVNTLLGMNATFLESSKIFIPISMTFAQTWTLHYVPTYDWVRTIWWRKLIRTLMAIVILGGILYGRFLFLKQNELVVLILINKITFVMLTPFFVFSILPVAFNWMGLVKREEQTARASSVIAEQ